MSIIVTELIHEVRNLGGSWHPLISTDTGMVRMEDFTILRLFIFQRLIMKKT